jgi:hypothetical protein
MLLPNPTDKNELRGRVDHSPQTSSMKYGVLFLGWILCSHANVFQEDHESIPDNRNRAVRGERSAPLPALVVSRRTQLQSETAKLPLRRQLATSPTPSPAPVATAMPVVPTMIETIGKPSVSAPTPEQQGPQPQPRPCPASSECLPNQNLMHLFCIREACVPNDRVVIKKKAGWVCGQCF